MESTWLTQSEPKIVSKILKCSIDSHSQSRITSEYRITLESIIRLKIVRLQIMRNFIKLMAKTMSVLQLSTKLTHHNNSPLIKSVRWTIWLIQLRKLYGNRCKITSQWTIKALILVKGRYGHQVLLLLNNSAAQIFFSRKRIQAP